MIKSHWIDEYKTLSRHKDRARERLQEENSCFDFQRGQLTEKRGWGKRDAERKITQKTQAIME